MRISTKDIKVGDLIRLSNGAKGEVISISSSRAFRKPVTLKDHLGRIRPHWVNDAGSVEIVDSITPHCPYC